MLGGGGPLMHLLASIETSSPAGVILLGTANNKRSFKLLPKMSVKVGRLLLPWRGLVSMCSAPFVIPFSFRTEGMMILL